MLSKVKSSLKKKKEQFVSTVKRLLSEQNRHFVMAVMIVLAVVVAGINLSENNKSEVTVSSEDNSVLVSLVYGDGDIETVSSEAPVVKDNRLSPVAVAQAAAPELETTTPVDGAIPAAAADSQNIALLGSDTLVRDNAVETVVSEKPRTEVTTYTVQGGDTISSIARKFNIDEATILEENKKFADEVIKPGDKLSILPVSGTTERVDEGETLESIAKKHDANIDEILEFNNLDSADAVEFAQILIIPDGKRQVRFAPRPEPRVVAAATPTTSTRSTSNTTTQRQTSTPTVKKGGRVGNRFVWGWCTWYVAERRGDVNWRGNAGTWLNGARSAGRATGKVPAVGSIMVTNESGYGHVAVVESVNGDTITVSEMNYKGFGVVSSRTLSAKSRVIKGFVY